MFSYCFLIGGRPSVRAGGSSVRCYLVVVLVDSFESNDVEKACMWSC